MLQWCYWKVHLLWCWWWCCGNWVLLPRRALTGSSIISTDQALGVGEALGRSWFLDLGCGCRLAASLPGSLGLSILLHLLGVCLCGGGAGVPLASHEGEDAAGQKSITPVDRNVLNMSETTDWCYLFLVSWGTIALASMFL